MLSLPLQWRHNERHGVSNHQRLHCLLNCWYRHHSQFFLRHMAPLGHSEFHYCDVIMGAMASQNTSLTIVCSTVHSGANQRKHQSSASLAFMWEIHRWPVNSPLKRPVTRKMFPFDDVIMSVDIQMKTPFNIMRVDSCLQRMKFHDVVMTWDRFPYDWRFMRGTSGHGWIPLRIGQFCVRLMFHLLLAWTSFEQILSCWRFRSPRRSCDVIVMSPNTVNEF